MATLFAIHCRRFGGEIVILGDRDFFSRAIGPRNYSFDIESAVIVQIPPIEFENQAIRIIDADRSMEILAVLGFTELPVGLASPSSLRIALEQTRTDFFRLNDLQLAEYNRLALEVSHES